MTAVVADLVLRLAADETVNQLEDMLQRARLIHRQTGAQHSEQHEHDGGDEKLHHDVIGPGLGRDWPPSGGTARAANCPGRQGRC